MKIECKIRRDGGTRVTMPLAGRADKAYHFAPNEHGAHVAVVTDEHHAKRFLSIPEAYAAYGEPDGDAASILAAIEKEAAQKAAAEAALNAVPAAPQLPVNPDQPAEALTLEEMDRPMLARVFEEVLREKAHHAAKPETFRARIADAVKDDPEAEARFNAIALKLGEEVNAE